MEKNQKEEIKNETLPFTINFKVTEFQVFKLETDNSYITYSPTGDFISLKKSRGGKIFKKSQNGEIKEILDLKMKKSNNLLLNPRNVH